MPSTMFLFPQADLSRFLRDECGAVTVDWVVLTGAVVGLGLATTAVVSAGVESISQETADELAGTSISTRFGRAVSLFSGNFSNGAGGFTGGTVINAPGFGEILQVGANDTVELTLDVPPGSTSATIGFDLIAADDFDGDTATIFVNGQAVSVYSDNDGNITVSDNGVSGVSVSVNQQYTNTNNGGRAEADSRATYSITVDNPGSSLTLGVASSQTADVDNEYFALDDVSVSAD